MALLVVLAVGSLFAARRYQEERDRTVRLAWSQAWSKLAQVRAARQSGQPGRRLNSLETLDEIIRLCQDQGWPEAMPSRPDLRNEMIACLALADLRPARSWKGYPADSWDVAFDAQFKHYARSSSTQNVSIHRVEDDEEIGCIPDTKGKWGLLFSPDGQFLAVVGDHLPVWELPRGQWLPVTFDQNRTLDFSPDNRLLAVGCRDGRLRLYDLPARRERPGWPANSAVFRAIQFHPGSERLAVFSSGTDVVQVRDLRTQELLQELPHPREEINCLAWRGDGRMLAAGCFNGRIYVWDLSTGRPPTVLKGHASYVTSLTFNRPGDRLVSNSWDNTLRLWDPLTGEPLFSTVAAIHGNVKFSSDDRLLASFTQGTQLGLWEVAADGEYCMLTSRQAPMLADFLSGSISPNGRLLAVPANDGVRLWDLATSTELCYLPLGRTASALFRPSEGELELLTRGQSGLLRWPIQAVPGAAGILHLGPPKNLALGSQPYNMALTAQGDRAALAGLPHGMIVALDQRPSKPVPLGEHPEGAGIAICPNGDWAATFTWLGTGVKIWNAHTGAWVGDLDAPGRATVCFSPDGRSLVVGTDNEFRFWSVGSWQPGRRVRRDGGGVPGQSAFASDNKSVALEASPGVLSILDPETDREFARLTDPNGLQAGKLLFGPGDDQLFVIGSGSLRVWDLRRLRERSAAKGLDWDLPAYPPPGDTTRPEPLRIEVLFDNQALRPDLQVAGVLNKLAWLLATSPDPRTRDPGRAVELARRATNLKPGEGTYWNTLGVAYYRAGDWKASVTALETSMRLHASWALPVLGASTVGLLGSPLGQGPFLATSALIPGRTAGGDCYDWFFLAMAHWKLGNKEVAWQRFAQAVARMDEHRSEDEELCRFRAEAAALLGSPQSGR